MSTRSWRRLTDCCKVRSGRQQDKRRASICHFRRAATAAAWRSEVLDYRLELGEDAAVGLYQLQLECRLLVVRRHYWESTTLTTLTEQRRGEQRHDRADDFFNHDDARRRA